MFHLKEHRDGYRLFQPAPEMHRHHLATKAEIEERNRRFLAAHRATLRAAPMEPITGTFVYGHAPDYGSSMLTATAADWRRRLEPLRDGGIDTVIFQAAAWRELEECYYPSALFRAYRQWNVIEPLLEAARALRLTVFLGEYGTVASWQQNGTPEAFAAETEAHLACLEELFARYRGGFHGVYFTSESGYPGHRDHARENAMARLYHALFSRVRERAAGMPVMLSPVSAYCPGAMDGMAAFWRSVFSLAAPDIVAPQDSVGTLCAALDHQRELYTAWAEITRALGARLWANVELFAFDFPAPGESLIKNAEPERIAAQIAAAAPFAEKNICWEALRFAPPLPAPQPV